MNIYCFASIWILTACIQSFGENTKEACEEIKTVAERQNLDQNCKKLHKAVKRGDFNLVSNALKNAKSDCQDEFGRTAIHIFAENKEIDPWIFILLFHRGFASLGIPAKDGTTPLMTAVGCNNQNALNYLFSYERISNSMKINKQNVFGHSALHFAAFTNNASFTRKLLKMKADLNLKDNFGRTARDIAEVLGFVDVIQELDKY